jgi:hypothetical protein
VICPNHWDFCNQVPFVRILYVYTIDAQMGDRLTLVGGSDRFIISSHKTHLIQKPPSALGFDLILCASMRESLKMKGALTRQLDRWL